MNGVNKVAVLMGGIGAERAVSLDSGRAVVAALQAAGVAVIGHDLHPDDLTILDDPSIDVFFPALHGTFGEDGQLQRIMAEKGLCFVGSEAAACALTFDKLRTKQTVQAAGLRTPTSVTFTPALAALLRDDVQGWHKWVVKPVCQGSSVGVTLSTDLNEVLDVARRTYEDYGDCMIERFIDGPEATVGVVLGETLPVIEIRPAQGFYDYHAKYEADSTRYLFDTLPGTVTAALEAMATQSFAALGMRHFGRIDFLVDRDNTPWFLEANAIPGLTSHSLLPKAAARVGQSMAVLCTRLVQAAAPVSGESGTVNLP